MIDAPSPNQSQPIPPVSEAPTEGVPGPAETPGEIPVSEAPIENQPVAPLPPVTPGSPAPVSAPAPESAPKKKGGLKTIIILLIFLGLAGGLAYAGYTYGTKNGLIPSLSQPKKEEVVEPIMEEDASPLPEIIDEIEEATRAADTSSWLTYVNQKFHYSVDYPRSLVLEAFSKGDNPFTEVVEVGDEGTFIMEKEADVKEGELRKSLMVSGIYLPDKYKEMALKELVETQGSFINSCHEDKPSQTQEIITKSGLKGYKVWYWVKAGCQGAEERSLN
ncbi:hypothetical protein COT75_03150, partial [Candidatus Beckwithbacteria bacterium CG10_big_fil_rev_8_21_14_0_10_34_10]